MNAEQMNKDDEYRTDEQGITNIEVEKWRS